MAPSDQVVRRARHSVAPSRRVAARRIPRSAPARAVCFHRLGRLRDRTAELQQHRASGLALVTAAIALWNKDYLDCAVAALRRRGETVPDPPLGRLAPLGWGHVNFTGDYL